MNNQTSLIYTDRIIAFIDILGFKKLITDTVVGSQSETEAAFNKLLDLYNNIEKHLREQLEEIIEDIEITRFSDCIVISVPAQNKDCLFEMCISLLHFQFGIFNKHKILMRGGITQGKLVHTDKRLFGPAMNRAYQLESQLSIYPRIIIDPIVIENRKILLTQLTEENDLYDIRNELSILLAKNKTSILKRDFDNFYYIDYINGMYTELDEPEEMFEYYLKDLEECINSNIKDEKVSHKFGWLKQKILPGLEYYSSK
jgi:hypothetical protein